MISRQWTWMSAGFLLAVTLSGCPKKQSVRGGSQTSQQFDGEKIPSDDVFSENVPELDTHGKQFVASSDLKAISFDYDSDRLSNEARQDIASNAKVLKKDPERGILIEGHCDQRGTVAYNLALGQRRAVAVRNYYMSLGVPPERMGLISYGKEKTICSETSEECWRVNRRAETKRMSQSTADIKE